jgi:hypothetical protein
MEGSKLKWAFSKSKDNSPCHVLLKFYYSTLYHHVVDVDEILYKIENQGHFLKEKKIDK